MSTIQRYLQDLHRRLAADGSGRVATYIPELGKADPHWFGIAVATVDGQVYEVGDTRQTFTIQSISKPMVYGVALEDAGVEQVSRTVGVEPSGEAFNSISLEPGTGRPMNPMINAGAIAAASLVKGATLGSRIERVVQALSAYAGRPLAVDHDVYTSERATGHRNRAIGHMLRNYEIVRDDPEPTLDLYFTQCSVLVDCRDLALMAATLANGGVHPLTGQRAVMAEHLGSILSVMTTCGVYDFTGEWVYRVGLPAKSGVGGGVIAVLPGQLGIGVFSPPLDERGNSVRGVLACETLSRELGLHFLRPPRVAESSVRARYTLASVRSKRRRTLREVQVLDRVGDRVRVFELQGDLRFATLEPVLRAVAAGGEGGTVVLDFKRVVHVDRSAAAMLASLAHALASGKGQLVLTRVRRGDLMAGFDVAIDPRDTRHVHFLPHLDAGLEWCERLLLEAEGLRAITELQPVGDNLVAARLRDHQLCEGLSTPDFALLQNTVSVRSFEAGATIVAAGDPADALYFVTSGVASVVVQLPGGGVKRLVTLSAGMGFGESALVSGGTRTADVRADTAVQCAVLASDAFVKLGRERPTLALRLMQNLLVSQMRTTQRLTAEVAALEG